MAISSRSSSAQEANWRLHGVSRSRHPATAPSAAICWSVISEMARLMRSTRPLVRILGRSTAPEEHLWSTRIFGLSRFRLLPPMRCISPRELMASGTACLVTSLSVPRRNRVHSLWWVWAAWHWHCFRYPSVCLSLIDSEYFLALPSDFSVGTVHPITDCADEPDSHFGPW